MGQTVTVSTAAELSAAINNASGGDRIELESGDYGELQLNSVSFKGEGVTIASADPDDMAVFDKIGLYRSENLHFDHVEIDFQPVGNTGYKVGFRAAEGDNISITNSVLHGGFNPDRDPEYADSPIGLGVQVQRTDNFVVEGNEIYDFHAGVSVAYVDGLTINDNHIHDMRTSPVAGGGVSNVEMIGNHFESSHPVNLGGTGDHGDMIHFYPLTNQEGPMENIVIRDNFLEQGTGKDAILGIYIDDAGSGGSGLGYSNVVIDNNIIHNGDAQGIRVENVDGLEITNNSLLQSSGTGLGSAPGIVLTSGTENVVIDNNIVAGLISGSSVNKASVEIGDNLFVQDNDIFGENYVGDLFVNGLTRDGEVSDLMPLEGSIAEGYGVDPSRFALPPDAHVAVISDIRGEGLEMQSIRFDVQSLYDSEGEIDFSTAELTWDFGDGTTGVGDDIEHTYDSAGSYDVTAIFTFEDGDVISVDKTVDVFTPQAVELNFERGIRDTSDTGNRVTTIGEVTLEEGRFGAAVRLVESESKVSIGRSEEILDNPNFSISFAFQKDGGSATNSDNGMFVYYSGTSYISTGNGTLAFTGSTSTGRLIRMEAEVPQIEDGAWHHITYTFSSDDRTATLYLDGEEVDQVSKISGIQHTTKGHNLLLGGRVDGAFGGLMDEVEFTRAALTAEEVEERYETLFNGAPDAPAEQTPEPEPDPEPTPDAATGEEAAALVEPDASPEPDPEPEPDAAGPVPDTAAASPPPITAPEPAPEPEGVTSQEDTAPESESGPAPEDVAGPAGAPQTPEDVIPVLSEDLDEPVEPETPPITEEDVLGAGGGDLLGAGGDDPIVPPPEPEPAPDPEPEPEPVPDPDPEPEPEPAPEPDSEPEPDPEPEAKSAAPAASPVRRGLTEDRDTDPEAEDEDEAEEAEPTTAIGRIAVTFEKIFAMIEELFGFDREEVERDPTGRPVAEQTYQDPASGVDLFDILTATGMLDETMPSGDGTEEEDLDGVLI